MLGWLLGRSNGTRGDRLICSKLYNEQTFYPVFAADLRKAQQEVIIESPFITSRRAAQLLPLLAGLRKRGVSVVVNTRHPDEHDNERSRLEVIHMIAAMQDVGVRVLYTGRLHRKVAIIDRRVSYEGSLNILSQVDSCELMRRVNSSTIAYALLDFVALRHRLPC